MCGTTDEITANFFEFLKKLLMKKNLNQKSSLQEGWQKYLKMILSQNLLLIQN